MPPFLVRKLFEQLFSFVNVQLFNQLLLRRECCSFSNGEYVKAGLSEVEQWIGTAGRLWVGDSWDALAHIRQAVTFLVIHQKQRKSLQEITSDLCPQLSVQQLYRISTMYWDDRRVEACGAACVCACLGAPPAAAASPPRPPNHPTPSPGTAQRRCRTRCWRG